MGRQVPIRAGVGASGPAGGGVCACGRTKGLSSGQTIGAVRTAVRPACCLPELRVANRLRRLCPLGTRFPTFPFGNLRFAPRNNRAPRRAASPAPAPESARQAPPREFLTAKLLPNAASRVAFRSPPCTPFGSSPKAIERPIGLQALLPRRSRRVRPRQGEWLTAELSLIDASRVAFRSPPCTPFGLPPK